MRIKEVVKSVLKYKKTIIWILLMALLAFILSVVCFFTNSLKATVPEETCKDGENLDTGQYLKDIEWEKFEARISADEYQALQKYLPILRGEEFVWIYRRSKEKGADTSIHAKNELTIQQMINHELEASDLESEEPIVNTILFADVFQSGNQNVCIQFRQPGWFWLILHEENGVIYGVDMPERWFGGVQKDGLYFGSGGAGTQYYHRMKFIDGDYLEEDVGEVAHGAFFMGGEKQSEGTYTRWIEENIKAPAKGYTPIE